MTDEQIDRLVFKCAHEAENEVFSNQTTQAAYDAVTKSHNGHLVLPKTMKQEAFTSLAFKYVNELVSRVLKEVLSNKN